MPETEERDPVTGEHARHTPDGTDNPAPFARFFLRNRVGFSHANQDSGRQWYFSPASVTLLRALQSAMREHVRGLTLDVGAGQLPLRELVRSAGARYESVDIERRHDELDHVGDAQTLSGFADASYDTVVCSQVLEHVPDPFAAMSAMSRVLRPGGRLVLTVPHLSRLHEIPHDYYRYTEYGLREMAERSGFDVVELRPVGGLFTFLGQQVCTVFMCVTWAIPLVRRVGYQLNRVLIALFLSLDRIAGAPRVFATSYLLVAERRS